MCCCRPTVQREFPWRTEHLSSTSVSCIYLLLLLIFFKLYLLSPVVYPFSSLFSLSLYIFALMLVELTVSNLHLLIRATGSVFTVCCLSTLCFFFLLICLSALNKPCPLWIRHFFLMKGRLFSPLSPSAYSRNCWKVVRFMIHLGIHPKP